MKHYVDSWFRPVTISNSKAVVMKTDLHLNRVIRELVKKYPSKFSYLFLAVGVQSLINGLSIVMVVPIVDFMLGDSDKPINVVTAKVFSVFERFEIDPSLVPLLVVFGALLLGSGVVGVLARFLILKIKYHVLTNLLSETMGRFLGSGYQFFSRGEVGKLLNSFQKEVEKLGDTLGLTVTGAVALLQVVLYLGIPIWFNPRLAVEFILVISLLTSPLWGLRRWAYKFGQENTQTANAVAKVLHENLTGAKLIISFNKQKYSTDIYRQAFRKHTDAAIKSGTLIGAINILFVPIGMLAVLVVLSRSYANNQALSEVAMLLFAFFRALPLAATVLQAKTSMEGFLPAFQQVDELNHRAATYAEKSGEKIFHELTDGLRFENVTFSYQGGVEALSGIDFDIAAGKVTALAGKSGSGKTTAVDLLLGLYTPQKGRVLVDGEDLRKYDLLSYRSRIGYVPQDVQLFDASIHENLLWAKPDATTEEIRLACEMAHVDEFISQLSNGVNYVVGDRGSRLSGGQRQRIALARALLRNPDLLLLDEATSALDSESESIIRASIRELSGQLTIVLIAHRAETMQLADQILVFHRGQIVQSGVFEDLSA
jgi:ABC-type multidrug transport system fused ATPase/permease subunit